MKTEDNPIRDVAKAVRKTSKTNKELVNLLHACVVGFETWENTGSAHILKGATDEAKQYLQELGEP